MASETSTHSIIDAVVDQSRQRWICYGQPSSNVWLPINGLHQNSAEIFKEISKTGHHILTAKSKETFKAAVEQRTAYRDGLVAAYPGWTNRHFICGDGRVLSPTGATEQIIVAFQADSKFSAAGTIQGAIKAFEPLVAGQTLPLFALALALVPPLLRYAPPDYGNVLVELVGASECGKTSLGAFAMSVWAGDPNSSFGGGRSWDITLASLDDIKARHSSMMLLLDEANLAGSEKKQAELIHTAVFKFETTGQKTRYGDIGSGLNTRMGLLSTTNTPLRELALGNSDVKEAVGSRMLTINVSEGRQYGIYDCRPSGCDSVGAAVTSLRATSNNYYGLFGPTFVQKLQRYDDVRVSAALKKCLDQALQILPVVDGQSARIRKALAIVMASGYIAQHLKYSLQSGETLIR